jgi:hypothetical protein
VLTGIPHPVKAVQIHGAPPTFRTADPLGSSTGKDGQIARKIQDLFT